MEATQGHTLMMCKLKTLWLKESTNIRSPYFVVIFLSFFFLKLKLCMPPRANKVLQSRRNGSPLATGGSLVNIDSSFIRPLIK